MGLTRDYVMRMVKQLAQGLARVMGLRTAGRLEEALVALGDTQRDALGDADNLVGKVDPETAARLLGNPETALAYAQILAERAEILTLLGDGEAANRTRLRALQVCLEARGLATHADEKTRGLVAKLRGVVGDGALSERYVKLLHTV